MFARKTEKGCEAMEFDALFKIEQIVTNDGREWLVSDSALGLSVLGNLAIAQQLSRIANALESKDARAARAHEIVHVLGSEELDDAGPVAISNALLRRFDIRERSNGA